MSDSPAALAARIEAGIYSISVSDIGTKCRSDARAALAELAERAEKAERANELYRSAFNHYRDGQQNKGQRLYDAALSASTPKTGDDDAT